MTLRTSSFKLRRRHKVDIIIKTRFFHVINTAQNKFVKKTIIDQKIFYRTDFYWLKQRRTLNSSV